MKDQFLIGELAALFQISTDTLRYYDRIGLIRPDLVGANGYRYYSLRNFFKLSRILFLRDLDLPLEEIKGYMDDKNAEKLVELLMHKQVELDHKIQSMINLRSKIQQKLDLIHSGNLPQQVVHIKALPERHVLYMSSSDQREPSSVKETLKTYGHLLKYSSWITEGQIYTSVTEDRLKLRDFQQFEYIFELAESESSPAPQLKTLPASDYACLIFKGPYSEIDHHYHRLLDWIADKNFSIIGHSIEKNIVDYDFSDSADEFISELQIPISMASAATKSHA